MKQENPSQALYDRRKSTNIEVTSRRQTTGRHCSRSSRHNSTSRMYLRSIAVNPISTTPIAAEIRVARNPRCHEMVGERHTMAYSSNIELMNRRFLGTLVDMYVSRDVGLTDFVPRFVNDENISGNMGKRRKHRQFLQGKTTHRSFP